MASPLLAEPEKYEVQEIIGRGAFGIIRKVLCRKEINYLKMSQKERDQLKAELAILSSLKHDNIVGYFHREHLEQTQELYIYMEYCGGGDLGSVIKNLRKTGEAAKEEFVWRIFSQLLTALYRCHYGVDAPEPGDDWQSQKEVRSGFKSRNQSMMILHRDLKPENIFLGADQSVKLGDFGLSKLMQSHDFASTYVGTPFYMSPEICLAEKYTLQSDIWAAGCIMYELCTLKPPFNAKTHVQLAQNIRKGVFEPLPSIYSRDLHNVIARCLRVNPHHRPDTASLLSIPYVWIARKSAEVAKFGKVLQSKEEIALRKSEEAQARLSALDQDKIALRQETEAAVRREWEVKARLEIDRQIQMELERLRKKFDREVNEKVQMLLSKQTRSIEQRAMKEIYNPPTCSDKENLQPCSSVSTSGEEDFSSTTDLTELSGLSLSSPTTSTTKPPPIKKTKAPFSRSKTTFESPRDTHMNEPSPMSISSLALSPRRNPAAQAALDASSNNIFAEAARQKAKWEPTLAYTSDDEDDTPELPSPTRTNINVADPFKMPARPARPGLLRQKTTATMQKLTTQPTLFPNSSNTAAMVRAATASGLPRTLTEPDMRPSAAAKSPNRRLSKIPSSATLGTDNESPGRKGTQIPTKATAGLQSKQAKDGTEEMFKAVMQRNTTGPQPRTLVELAQARAGGRPLSVDMGNPSQAVRIALDRAERELPPIPIWDPEKDEMPSPFLARGNKVIRGIR